MSDDEKHIDNLGVDGFAQCMKAKLRRKRLQGYGGWDREEECSIAHLQELLREHVARGFNDRSNLVDIANFCMMIHHRMQLAILAGEPHA